MFLWLDRTSLCLDPYFISHDFMNITGMSHFPNHSRGVADIRQSSLDGEGIVKKNPVNLLSEALVFRLSKMYYF